MCGIAGIVDLKNRAVPEKVVRDMTATLAHRGPNGEGFCIQGEVGLGHRRLSILDLSEAGHQPMFSDSGKIAVIFNGEIYNYIELKKELGGRKYRSGTDTEVILRAYERWGERCFEKFNGIFAIALWDSRTKKILLARDHLGVKPLYYAVYNNRLYFASEIKAVLEAGVPAKPNDKIIYEYLVYGYYDHSAETFFRGIKQLMPGTNLMVQNGRLTPSRYWHLPDRVRDLSGITDQEVSGTFLELLKNSAKIQLRSDVPVGLSVSGGLDSSLLISSVNRVVRGQRNFNLYHFTYKGRGYDVEIPYVTLLAKKLGWQKPTVVEVTPPDMPELINKIMWHEEQPFPGLPTVAWHKLYQFLGKTPTIVTLEGHGGDEMAAGYDYYVSSFLLDVLRRDGAALMLKEFQALAKIRNLPDEKLLPFFVNGLEAYLRGGVSADASRFVNLDCLDQKFLKLKLPPLDFPKPFDSELANFQYRELVHTKLPRVLRSVDRESMAYGRELRVPLLDHRLVEFAFSLPLNQRIRDGHQRFFMRNAGKKILPKSISHTPKRSLPNPQRAWFQRELRPWIWSILSSKSFKSRKYFDQKRVIKEYQRYVKEPQPANSFHIWQWLSIELWFRAFID